MGRPGIRAFRRDIRFCRGYTVDEFRHAIEKIDPAHYLELSYYEHWLYAFEEVLIKRGFVTREELDARIS